MDNNTSCSNCARKLPTGGMMFFCLRHKMYVPCEGRCFWWKRIKEGRKTLSIGVQKPEK